MKQSIVFLISLIFSHIIYAGGQSTSGGGGVIINGKVMTFVTYHQLVNKNIESKAAVILNFLTSLDIAAQSKESLPQAENNYFVFKNAVSKNLGQFSQLKKLLTFVKNSPVFDFQERTLLLQVINPSQDRKYSDLKISDITHESKTLMIDEYSAITLYPKNKITLFAITESQTQKTFIFPTFYQLTETEQIAILFHENLWLAFPNADYKTIIQIEGLFQYIFETPFPDQNIVDIFQAKLRYLIMTL